MSKNDNVKRFISNPVVQTFLVYISGGWIILEMTDYFISNYSLTERFRDILLIIMIVGLPVALFISWYLSRDQEAKEDKERRISRLLLKRPWFSIPGIIVIVLLLFTAVRYIYQHDEAVEPMGDMYSSVSELMKRSGAQISLAVLPFTNYTENPDQDWLVSGQQETLINELSKLSQAHPLRVISSRTVNAFKSYDKTIPELAKEIDVDYLVEASVMEDGDSVTLQLRLIHVDPEENVVWAESCSSDYSNMLKLHSDIASQIATSMDLDVSESGEKGAGIPRQVSPESYKAYLRGMYNLNQLTPESMEIGLEYLHEAVKLDPADPFAYAGLALGYLEVAHGPLDPGDALAKAEAAANQAIRLDSTIAEIYAAMAEVYLYKTWEFEKAEEYFKKALKINPNLAMAHYHYSWALYLWERMDEAIAEHKLAQLYDPFNPLQTAWLAALYTYDGQYDLAIKTAEESFEIQEDYIVGYFVLGTTYALMGEYEKAIENHKKLAEIFPPWSFPLGMSYVKAGMTEDAEAVLQQIESLPENNWRAISLVLMHGALGNIDEALEWLEYEPHHAWTAWTSIMPEFEPVRKDPRYQDFLERLNFAGVKN